MQIQAVFARCPVPNRLPPLARSWNSAKTASPRLSPQKLSARDTGAPALFLRVSVNDMKCLFSTCRVLYLLL